MRDDLAAPLVRAALDQPQHRPRGQDVLEAKGLSGTKEVPRGAPTGNGAADFTITGRKVCWDFTIGGIGKPLAAHTKQFPNGAIRAQLARP